MVDLLNILLSSHGISGNLNVRHTVSHFSLLNSNMRLLRDDLGFG